MILNIVYLVVAIGLLTLMATWVGRIWAWIREIRTNRRRRRRD